MWIIFQTGDSNMFVNRGLLSVLHFQIKSSATNKKTRTVVYETDFSNLVKY